MKDLSNYTSPLDLAPASYSQLSILLCFGAYYTLLSGEDGTERRNLLEEVCGRRDSTGVPDLLAQEVAEEYRCSGAVVRDWPSSRNVAVQIGGGDLSRTKDAAQQTDPVPFVGLTPRS